jgi:alkylation response protein AidB-like acyl-CoA dehydrogenase
MAPVINSKPVSLLLKKYYFDGYSDRERNVTSGWASLAKYTCSDLGMKNANLALDLMGADGLRHEKGAEKCFRDVKLQQIYESTNQINQINLFSCLIADKLPEVKIFE